MTKPTPDQILVPKPVVHPRIYAYTIDDAARAGLLKIGQTTRDMRQWSCVWEKEISLAIAASTKTYRSGRQVDC